MLLNGLLSELSSTFRKITFSESQFPANILNLDIRYEYLESQIKNIFYLFSDQLDYILVHYFAKLETIKCNIDKFFSILLIKSITEKLSYRNVN